MPLTRRQFLGTSLLKDARSSTGTGLRAIGIGGADGPVSQPIVAVFLRGGADGLNMIPPYADDNYYRMRPTLALPPPGDKRENAAARAINLDGYFGLHPALGALQGLYGDGELAVVHAAGSLDQTRSHFEAMSTMERGAAGGTGPLDGWLARHLRGNERGRLSPLRAVAFADSVPESLRGDSSAVALRSITEFQLQVPDAHAQDHNRATALFGDALHALYSREECGDVDISHAGIDTLRALDVVSSLRPAEYRSASGAVYPNTETGGAFRQTACLIKGGAGVEVVCIDMGGWDTHVAQGRDTGWQANLLRDLAGSIAAFHADMRHSHQRPMTVVMTEFGRRAHENAGGGTDHGRASCMLVAGKQVRASAVYSRWPGLYGDRLEGPGDLRVTTDYRDVLSEVLAVHSLGERLRSVFPGFKPHSHGLLKSNA